MLPLEINMIADPDIEHGELANLQLLVCITRQSCKARNVLSSCDGSTFEVASA